MPLPPIADNATDRYWLKYTSKQIEHELCFRLGTGTTNSDGIAAAVALATAMKPYIYTVDSFSALRKSEAGSDLSFPLAWTSIAGTGTVGSEKNDEAKFLSLVGRSAGGYRCRITFFTAFINDDLNYRVPSSTTGAPAAFYNAVTSQSPVFVSKQGTGVIWNAYVNNGYNSYWQRQLR